MQTFGQKDKKKQGLKTKLYCTKSNSIEIALKFGDNEELRYVKSSFENLKVWKWQRCCCQQ